MTGCTALILAGGSGVRLGADLPKQYLLLAGEPILRRSLRAFLDHPAVDAVRVVIGAEDRERYDEAVEGLDLLPAIIGGATRQESGRLGLESLEGLNPQHVMIHDAARPLVSADLIGRVIAALDDHPGAIPAMPVVDTLKRSDDTGARAVETVERTGLWRAQTPQGFRYADILAAHRALDKASAGRELTDDAAIAQAAGLDVALVTGDEDNIKVTTMDDLTRAARILTGASVTRVGTGFDVHRFGTGDSVMLCGVRIPHDRGLEGHSDADVALHAITDALLGAIAAGDIGMHFPPSDEKWRGAASDVFLRHAASLVRDTGGEIVNIDVTLICEAPKIGPHRQAMAARVAEIVEIEAARVGVKGTTTEGLGFTGRGEGIAAQAVASVRLPNP